MKEELMPNNNNLLIIKELDYVCGECKKIISGIEVEFQKMASNFNIAGLKSESEIPKCPHCGTLAFFGLKELKDGGL